METTNPTPDTVRVASRAVGERVWVTVPVLSRFACRGEAFAVVPLVEFGAAVDGQFVALHTETGFTVPSAWTRSTPEEAQAVATEHLLALSDYSFNEGHRRARLASRNPRLALLAA